MTREERFELIKEMHPNRDPQKLWLIVGIPDFIYNSIKKDGIPKFLKKYFSEDLLAKIEEECFDEIIFTNRGSNIIEILSDILKDDETCENEFKKLLPWIKTRLKNALYEDIRIRLIYAIQYIYIKHGVEI